MQRAVERGLGRMLARDLGEPLADLLQGERIVAEQVPVLLDERERRLGRLVVAVDRRSLAPADVTGVAHLDLNDVLPVARLTSDHERLGQAQPDDGGRDLHLGSLLRGADAHDVGDHVGFARALDEAGRHQLRRRRCDLSLGRVSEGYPVDPDTNRVSSPAAAPPRPARSCPPSLERGASA